MWKSKQRLVKPGVHFSALLMSWELYSLNPLCPRKLAILTFFMSPDLSLWTCSKSCDRLPLHNILNVIYLFVFYIEKKKKKTLRPKTYVWSVSSVQLLSHVQLFVTPWTVARQASLSITNSQSLLKLMSIESVMPSNHFILCRPLLLCLQSRLWEADILEYNHC